MTRDEFLDWASADGCLYTAAGPRFLQVLEAGEPGGNLAVAVAAILNTANLRVGFYLCPERPAEAVPWRSGSARVLTAGRVTREWDAKGRLRYEFFDERDGCPPEAERGYHSYLLRTYRPLAENLKDLVGQLDAAMSPAQTVNAEA